ncbi:MAG TPA: Sua5/YciO/YrdC/YwlC family protein [Solirubrobacteraceae bacterium]|nr:Sua5/YciO/YrdC/YwlC family protein [Solirubrobacteraceae bacterium]
MSALSSRDAEKFSRCVAAGGVVVFPADTVYGLACDPENAGAVNRLYALKGRRPDKPAAVMFFELEVALDALPELGPRTRAAMPYLLPGAVTLLVPNPAHRFPLAGGSDLLGLRVPRLERLAAVGRPVLQSSANRTGGPDARRLADVPEEIRAGADLVIDGGELPGTPSTVVDLREYDEDGPWQVVREGAVGMEELERALGGQFHFRPESYERVIVDEMPGYHELQRRLVEASGAGARRILELGTGTGVTAARLLERHPEAKLVGVDASAEMLGAARSRLPGERVELRVGQIEDELPSGPFDLVASALCVHHLDGSQKADLFRRVRERLVPGGRFVLGDLVTPEDPGDAQTPFTPGFDKPSSVPEQLEWMMAAGLQARVAWEEGDLAIFVADAPPAGIVAAT